MSEVPIIQPPASLLRFFRWFCNPAYAEDIEGDLREMFDREVSAGGVTKARLKFSIHVLRLFRPGIIRKVKIQSHNSPSPMFRNYVIASIRSLMRNKGFSALNIAGLAVGLATFSLISFYVYYETSFDKYHKNADRIFRIVEDLKTENEMLFQAASSPPMGPHFQKDYPEVEKYVRFQNWSLLAQVGNITSYEKNSYIVDSTVFDVFSWKLLKGDKKTALVEPYSIVLTESMAKKYFGNEDPLGQSIKMDYDNYKITGVMEDVPENSHFTFSNLISFSTWSKNNKEREDGCWFCNGYTTYLLLHDAKSVETLRAKMPDFLKKNIEKGGMFYQDLPLQPLASIYMAPPRSWENGTRGSMSNVYILSTIAVFILLIACFNYINLTTARASRRLKEVGLRKTLGAVKQMLITQFLGESIIVTFVAFVLAIILAWIALPAFRTLVESPLGLSILPQPWIIAGVGALLVLAVGLLAGAYPAFIISRFEPLQIFRPASMGMFGHNNLRKFLVGVQFVITITLVAGTMLVYDQLDVVRKQNLGFDKEGMIVVPTNGDTAIVNYLESVKNELKTVPGVVSIAGSQSVPGTSVNNLYTEIEMTDGKMSPTNINYNFVDYDFLTTYNIQLLAGRDFRRDVKADDTTAYLINETAVKDFGWTPEQALGKRINRYGRVIGVVKDFHYKSLHTQVEPMLMPLTKYVGRLSFRIEGNDLPATLSRIEQKWHSLIPYLPFDYSFLDVDYDKQYKADQQLGKVAGVFTGLAIFIGCLGLLGLTSFVVERRTKEIGIRKVLGASVTGVVVLITNEFIWLIVAALVVATPLTWYLIAQWEQNFTLQATINPLRFVIAGFAVFAFAWITIGYLSFRAANANPTKALRTE
ncbi:MAG: ABC transporter permease [Bacteroidota bacterium]